MKRLPFSAKDFADYLWKAEYACANAAFDGTSEARHERLLGLAEELEDAMTRVMEAKPYASLDEMCIALDLCASQYRTSRQFWVNVFKDVAANSPDHWVSVALTATVGITKDGIDVGLFDKAIIDDALIDFLEAVNENIKHLTSYDIASICSAWCARKSRLEKKC